jgi:CPA2 family monovalent cation:H+ antiporter-2
LFDFNGTNLNTLELIAEFGVVFLMFTIGLELNINKMKTMKEILFVNGFFQVTLSAIIIFTLAHFLFNLEMIISIIISLAFALSSTAIVLPYLKESKDIITPYGQKSVAILIFQDLAVIPILLLITFLTNDSLSILEVLARTFIAALFIIVFMFTLGKRIVALLLTFSAKTQLEELFLGSVFTIVIGASLLAHEIGFTYSLGAFIAGMIISDTKYNVKVESDILTYKDLLLGTFFFSVGTKIDIVSLFNNIDKVLLIALLVMLIKAIVIYFIINFRSNKSTSIKTAISLSQIGDFSFAVVTLAYSYSLISKELTSLLILITVFSMIITPFMLNNIYKLSSYFVKEFYESDKITPIKEKNHIIVVGFATLGRLVCADLKESNISFVIISNNLKHVLLAKKLGYKAYFGHLNKKSVLESLKVKEASNILITVNTQKTKRLISQAVLEYDKDASIIIKIDSIEERKNLKDLNSVKFIDANKKISNLMLSHAKVNI